MLIKKKVSNLNLSAMLLLQRQDDLIEICKYWGDKYMSTVAMEECAEMIQVISKIKRYHTKPEHKDHLTEEVADVLICIAELMIHDYLNSDEVVEYINRKIDRSLKRMEIHSKGGGFHE